MATNVHDIKTTDLVFKGKDYSSWRSRMMSMLECEDFDDLIRWSDAEDEYIDTYARAVTGRDDRTEAQRAYAKRQAKAKNLLYNHMDTPYFRLIRACPTVREIFDRLDNDFFASSEAGLVQLRKELTNRDYDGKVSIPTFITDYELRCEAYIDAGGILSSTDWVHQLQGALPPEFDSVIDWFQSQPESIKTYAAYRAKLIEKSKRLLSAKKIPSSVHYVSPTTSATPAPTSSTPATSPNTPSSSRRCHYCRELNHLIRDCPKLKQRSDTTPTDNKQSTSTENTKKDDKPAVSRDTTADWSKFKSLSINKPKEDPKENTSPRTLGMMARVRISDVPYDSTTSQNFVTCNVFPANIQAIDSSVPDAPVPLGDFDDCVLLDSGTEYHLTNDINDLFDVQEPTVTYCIHGINTSTSLVAKKIGKMHIKLENVMGITEHITTLHNVLYVPSLSTKLLSVARIVEKDIFGVNFRANVTQIYDTNDGSVVASAMTSDNHLTWIRYKRVQQHTTALPAQPTIFVQNADSVNVRTTPADVILLWHRRLGHVNAKYLRWLTTAADGVPEMKIIDSAFTECTTCIQAKSTRLPHDSTRTRPTRRFEIVSSDICDAKCMGITGHKMFLTFIDNFSGFVEIILLKSKSDVPTELAKFLKWISNKFPSDPVTLLRCDGAREYTSGDTKRFCDAAGIRIDSGCPFNPELNGLAERKNRSILEKIRVLLLDACLAVEYWPFAAKTAAYILNRIPCKTNENNRTPYEIIFQKKPDLSNIRVFGSIALRHLPEQTRARAATTRKHANMSKLGPVAVFAIMFGYTSTGYEVLEFDTHRTLTTRDIRFLETENILTFEKRHSTLRPLDSASIDNTSSSSRISNDNAPTEGNTNVIIEDNTDTNTEGTPHVNTEELEIVEIYPQQLVIPPDHSDQLPAPLDPVLDDISRQPDELAVDIDSALDHLAIDPVTRVQAMTAGIQSKWHRKITKLCDYIPKSYNDAISCKFSEHWIAAINKEFDAHHDNHTWHLVPRSEASHLIRTLWVFTTKFDTGGNEFAKARLVAFGCADPNDYAVSDTYAAVCPIETIRLLLSFAIKFHFSVTTMDVATAFLYGQIQTNVYLSIPQGLNINRTNYALKLDKALYGLRISSKLWNDCLRTELTKIGYITSVCERCLYYFRRDRHLAILVTYVDDLLLVSNSPDVTEYTLQSLVASFRMTVNRDPTSFIGLNFTRTTDGHRLSITQSTYIRQLATQFQITEGRVFSTPMESNLKLEVSSINNDDREYRAYIGALLYVARFSRPDIAFAVNVLSKHQGHVTPEVKSYVKCVLKYLIGTRQLALQYTDTGDSQPWRAFIDASHATEDQYRSISGFVLFNYGNAVDWSTRKQPILALSSTASEIIAIATNLDAILVPRALLFELFDVETTVDIYEDNSSAIFALGGGQNKKLKWTLIKAHAVLEAVQNGYIRLNQVPSSSQLADGLTKALDKPNFERMRTYFLQ